MTLLTGKSSRPGQKAFTLVELLLVIVVISVLAGISVPRFRRTYSDIRLASSAQDLASLMKYAQERAIMDGISFKIEFDISGKEYRLLRETEPFSGVYEREKGIHGRAKHIPSDISFDVSAGETVFLPDGRTYPVKIYLKNRNGKKKVLSTERAGGRIRIYDEGEGK